MCEKKDVALKGGIPFLALVMLFSIFVDVFVVLVLCGRILSDFSAKMTQTSVVFGGGRHARNISHSVRIRVSVFLYKTVSKVSLETLWDLILGSFWHPKVSTILLLGCFFEG